MEKKDKCTVLFADDDPLLCSAASEYLSLEGIVTTVAGDGRQALDAFDKIKPDVVVTDLRMPVMDGIGLLENIKKRDANVPVIISTGDPDIESAISALKQGADDYLVKPLQLEILAQKVRSAYKTSCLSRENSALSEMVALYAISSKLAATRNVDALLDVVFRYGLELTGAVMGAICLRGSGDEGLVYARQRGLSQLYRSSPDAEAARLALASHVFATGKPLFIEDGSAKAPVAIPQEHSDIHTAMAVPLGLPDKTIGVLIVERDRSQPRFSLLDFNRIEIIASQAGIALANADLSMTLNKKLDALKLVSTFSEQISGQMDTDDLLRALFEKVHEHCGADIVGFLLYQERHPEFCYWARGPVDDIEAWKICRSVIDYFNERAPGKKILERRVTLRHIPCGIKTNGRVALPPASRHFVPMAGENGFRGIFFAGGAARGPESVENESFIGGLVNQVRIAIVNAQLYNDMKENYLKTIRALATAVDAKDNYTRGHSEKVMTMAEELAREMQEFDDRHVAVIRDAALLHDIGKIGIPGHILNKPGALTFDEFDGVMKKHSMVGANIVKEVPFLSGLYTLILHHHEHFDGSGYPHGLKGDAIPLGARILHVADAFDAMTSDRPYRSSLGHKEAIRRIVADSGKHFDPGVVGVLLRVARRKGIIE